MVDEHDGTAMRFRFMLRELQQVQRAFDVDLVRRNRRELRPRREQRRQVEDQVDLELRHEPLEQRLVGDRPGDLAIDLARDRLVQPRHIERDDAAVAAFCKLADEAMADFAAGPGDDDDRFAHQPRRYLNRMGSVWNIDTATERTVASRQTAAPMK